MKDLVIMSGDFTSPNNLISPNNLTLIITHGSFTLNDLVYIHTHHYNDAVPAAATIQVAHALEFHPLPEAIDLIKTKLIDTGETNFETFLRFYPYYTPNLLPALYVLGARHIMV